LHLRLPSRFLESNLAAFAAGQQAIQAEKVVD